MTRKANYELYHCRDARSFRVLWCLEELQVKYSLNKLKFPPRIHHKEFLEVNPMGTVPALVMEEKVMTESSGIVEYLVRIHESDMKVDLSDESYSQYLDWVFRSDATFTFPLTLVLRYSKFEKKENQNEQITSDYTRWFLSRIKSVERTLERSDYLVNDKFTAADICVGYSLFLAEIMGFKSKLGPRTQDYLERLKKRPAFIKSLKLQDDMTFYL